MIKLRETKKDQETTIMDMVEAELHSIQKVKDISKTIREFNKLKYPEPPDYRAEDIIRIRKKLHVSQAVLAYLINTKLSTIQKWESGVNHPNGPASRLLQIIESKGLETIKTN